MRSNPAHFALTAERTLEATLARLAEGTHRPLAGGTELMVAFAAGRLPTQPLLSLHHLRELRFIHVEADAVTLGAGTTFADIRHHPELGAILPMLVQTASWTGSVANQNRATLGGNLCNASPAADSPPALLCYGSAVTLVSAAGTRTIPYEEFHLGYRQTALRPDELLHSVRVARPHADARGFVRKVGTRNAQAISKVALGALLRIENGCIAEARVAAASLAPIPLRLRRTEEALLGRNPSDPEVLRAARRALHSEATPIDDIRSTAAYRVAVAGHLLEQALEDVRASNQGAASASYFRGSAGD